MVTDRPSYYGEPIGSHTLTTRDPSQTPYDHLFPPNWGLATPTKLASQIAAKRYQIQGWFVATLASAYVNLPDPYPMVPSSTP